MQWGADQQVQQTQYQQRALPTAHLHQPLRQRPEHRAGKASEERQRRDRFALALFEHLRQHRKGRVVQRGGHDDPQARPHEVKLQDGLHVAQRDEQQAPGDRADGHDPSATMPIDEAADRRRSQTCGQHGGRECTNDRWLVSADRCRQRIDHQREGVVKRAPRDDLGHAEGHHDGPWRAVAVVRQVPINHQCPPRLVWRRS